MYEELAGLYFVIFWMARKK